MAVIIPIACAACLSVALNLHWFGHVLGARPQIEAAATAAHSVEGPVGNPLSGAFGLLISPSRGILLFSPVVLVVVVGRRRLERDGSYGPPACFLAAALVQFATYASYSAWWGGHTYGPRLVLDILPLMIPAAVSGTSWCLAARWRASTAAALLAWSILVAGTGAFVYPHERWNTDPLDVDSYHDRLWSWRDPQFVRCWYAGPSPQNGALFSRDVFRR